MASSGQGKDPLESPLVRPERLRPGPTDQNAAAVLADFFFGAADTGITGTLAATESGADTFASTGTVLVQGTLAATESGSDTFASTGTVQVQGALAATESGSDTFASTGTTTNTVTGTLAATEAGSDTFASTGTVKVQGTMAATESLVDVFSSDMTYEEDQELTGFGLAPVKAQGQATVYDTMQQGVTTRYTHIAYSLGFIITREAIDDNQYEKVGMQRTGSLAFSMRQTKENVVANLYNRGFSTSYPIGDAAAMLSASHPTLAGNQSNKLAVDADLSEASLEDLVIQIGQAQNSRGLRISLQAKSLIIPVQLQFEAARILKSVQQNDTANNAINALRSMGAFTDGVAVNH